MLPQITEIILIKKPLVDAETKLRKKHFPGVGRERGAAHPVHVVLLATNHKTVEVKVAPIECDLEQAVQRGDAAVAAHMQTAPNRRVDLEEQDVELVNFNRSIWLDHSGPRSLVAADSAPVFPGLALPLIWRESGSGTRAVVESVLKDGGVNPRKLDQRFELGSNEALKSLVTGGLGVGFFSCWEIQQKIATGLVRQINFLVFEFSGCFLGPCPAASWEDSLGSSTNSPIRSEASYPR